MKTTKELITDEQIEKAFGYANFGDTPKRDVLENALLKYLCGYRTGFTAQQILKELNLITGKENVTTLGKQYAFEAFKNNLSV